MKQIVDISKKVEKLPDTALLTKQKLYELERKENAALIICAGVLGNCYLMLEIIDWYYTESIGRISKQSWFKNDVKYNINNSIKQVKKEIKASRRSSQSSTEYLTDMADGMYDILKQDLFIFKNSIMLALKDVKYDTSAIADIIVIDTLLSWNVNYYDITMKQMKEFYSMPDYNSWFYPARCTVGNIMWKRAIKSFSEKYIKGDIDLNTSDLICNAMHIIDNKMNSDAIAEKLRNEHCNSDNGSTDILTEAFNVFGRDYVSPVENEENDSN